MPGSKGVKHGTTRLGVFLGTGPHYYRSASKRQIRIWKQAREKARRWIRWHQIMNTRPGLFDDHAQCLMVQEDCHGSGVACSNTNKCCIFCDKDECGTWPCGCTKARDTVWNLWYCEEDVDKSEKQPWQI